MIGLSFAKTDNVIYVYTIPPRSPASKKYFTRSGGAAFGHHKVAKNQELDKIICSLHQDLARFLSLNMQGLSCNVFFELPLN